MRWVLSFVLLVGGLVSSARAAKGKTSTNWDCCKPACAWSQNLSGVSGFARTCSKDNDDLSNQQQAKSGCDNGPAFMCENYQPVPVSEKLSYGFAVKMDKSDCCKCFNVTWTSGAARGKTMVVQAINVGRASGDVKKEDIIVMTPGGGVGPSTKGCAAQYGSQYSSVWGDKNGGLKNRDDCAKLPSVLQGGCYWRWNWAKGDLNRWDVNYERVSCPQRLVDISGCEAQGM